MKCSECGEKIEKKWKFCPHCGEEVHGFFSIFKKKQLSPEEEMQKMLKPMEGMLKMMGFPKINIKVSRGMPMPVMEEQAAAKQKAIRIPAESSEEESPRRIKEILEPRTKITKVSEGIKYVLVVPGVKNPKDIKIRQLEESIEIKAYAKDKAYFKVIPIKPGSQIIDKKYQEEMLKLVVS